MTDEEKYAVNDIVSINVFIDDGFKKKVDWLSNNYDKEIGGFILGEVRKGGIIIQDLLIPKQSVSAGEVDFDKKDLITMRIENEEKCNRIIGEWHSHNTISCFWSSVDETLIKEFSESRDLSVFMVSSKGEHLIRVEIRKPVSVSLDKLNYMVINSSVEMEMLKEISEKVEEKVVVYKGEKCDKWKKGTWEDDMYGDDGYGNYENFDECDGYGKDDISRLDDMFEQRNVLNLNKKKQKALIKERRKEEGKERHTARIGRLNVKLFRLDDNMRALVLKEFPNYAPLKVGKDKKDLLYAFSLEKNAKEFHAYISYYINAIKRGEVIAE